MFSRRSVMGSPSRKTSAQAHSLIARLQIAQGSAGDWHTIVQTMKTPSIWSRLDPCGTRGLGSAPSVRNSGACATRWCSRWAAPQPRRRKSRITGGDVRLPGRSAAIGPFVIEGSGKYADRNIRYAPAGARLETVTNGILDHSRTGESKGALLSGRWNGSSIGAWRGASSVSLKGGKYADIRNFGKVDTRGIENDG